MIELLWPCKVRLSTPRPPHEVVRRIEQVADCRRNPLRRVWNPVGTAWCAAKITDDRVRMWVERGYLGNGLRLVLDARINVEVDGTKMIGYLRGRPATVLLLWAWLPSSCCGPVGCCSPWHAATSLRRTSGSRCCPTHSSRWPWRCRPASCGTTAGGSWPSSWRCSRQRFTTEHPRERRQGDEHAT